MSKEKTKLPETGPGPSQQIRSLIGKDLFPKALGISFGRVAPGYAEATLTIQEDMLNFAGVTHGGVIFALADTVFGAASNAYGETALAIHADISFLRATKAGDVLTARAVEESRSGRLAHVRVTVADAGGRLVALFQGVAYIRQNSRAPRD